MHADGQTRTTEMHAVIRAPAQAAPHLAYPQRCPYSLVMCERWLSENGREMVKMDGPVKGGRRTADCGSATAAGRSAFSVEGGSNKSSAAVAHHLAGSGRGRSHSIRSRGQSDPPPPLTRRLQIHVHPPPAQHSTAQHSTAATASFKSFALHTPSAITRTRTSGQHSSQPNPQLVVGVATDCSVTLVVRSLQSSSHLHISPSRSPSTASL